MIVAQIGIQTLDGDRCRIVITNLEAATLRFLFKFRLTFFDPGSGNPVSGMDPAERRAYLDARVLPTGLDDPTKWLQGAIDVFVLRGTVALGPSTSRSVSLDGRGKLNDPAPFRQLFGHLDVSLPDLPALGRGAPRAALDQPARVLLSGARTALVPVEGGPPFSPDLAGHPRLIQEPCAMASGKAEHLIPPDSISFHSGPRPMAKRAIGVLAKRPLPVRGRGR
jgi:hypothetical protein